MRVTKRQLRRIIKEALTHSLKENRSGLPQELQDKSDEELEDVYAEMALSGEGDKETLDALKDYFDDLFFAPNQA